IQEILTTLAFLRAYRQIRPDVILHYTIKPNLYGSLAARVLRIPVIDNVTGLGAVFEQRGAVQFAVRLLYRAAFARVERVFFSESRRS
ncbi:MAG: glycosyltransferase, partial [Spirochaetia bacterium]